MIYVINVWKPTKHQAAAILLGNKKDSLQIDVCSERYQVSSMSFASQRNHVPIAPQTIPQDAEKLETWKSPLHWWV